jgi:glycosyltransferase involved in cell wall biosynthesis
MKIILFANTDWYLYKFRINQAKELRALGVEVVLVSPRGEFASKLQEMGFRWLELPLSRLGMNPISESRAIMKLAALYRAERPDLVHHFTIKSVLYGTVAARLAGIKCIINGVTGLGYVFNSAGGLAKRMLRAFVEAWYRLSLRGTQVIFDNDEDKDFFAARGLVSQNNAHVIRSAGVDVDTFIPMPEPEGTPVVILAGRMLLDKGIAEYVEAARLLNERNIAVRCALVGDPDPGNPRSVTREQLQAWHDSGAVEWWGFRSDMLSVFRAATIVCLPSYREGLPTTLIEASACGRAIVATDVPGCRDAVIHGETGWLVKAQNAAALADGLAHVLRDPALRAHMAEAGRRFAVNEFSTARVNRDTWEVYAQAGLEGLLK